MRQQGFTLSIDRPVEWTAKLQKGWPATETEEASPDEGIRLYTDDKYKIVDEVEMD